MRIAVLISLLFANLASAAISFDAVGGAYITAASGTWSHTVGTGSNTILIIGCNVFNNTVNTPTVNSSTTGVTLAKNFAYSDNGGSNNAAIYYLLAPPTGSVTVGCSASTSMDGLGWSVSLFGVDQGSPVDASNGNHDLNQTSLSIPITTVNDQAWLTGSFNDEFANDTFSAGNGTLISSGNGGGSAGAAYYRGPITPAGATTLTATASTNRNFGEVIASWKPAASGGATSVTSKRKKLMNMGVD